MNRGEIRWYTFRRPDKRRPVLILTRSDVIDQLNEIIVAPATRTIRGLATEVRGIGRRRPGARGQRLVGGGMVCTQPGS